MSQTRWAFGVLVVLLAAGCASAASTVAKRGLLFPWDSVASDLNTKGWNKTGCPKAEFVMTWELWKFGTQDPKLEFIPLARTSADAANIPSYLPAAGVSKLAFLNEPDLPGSTQLDVATAVSKWNQYAIPQRQQHKTYLLSPAMTSDPSYALPWMDAFIKAVGSNKPDALALHYYGTDSNAFISWITQMHTRYNLDVWVTEVASTSNNLASVQSFQAAIMAWADQTSWVKGLAWFAVSRHADQDAGLATSALMGSDGSKLDLGYKYCYN